MLVRAGVSVALLAAAAAALTSIVPGSEGRLGRAAPGWIGLEVIFEVGSMTGYVALFAGVFAPGYEKVGLIRSAQIALGELGAFAILPTGAGGPVLRVWALLASGMRFEIVMIRSVVHAVIFNLPYFTVAVLLGLSVLIGSGPGQAPVAVALAPVAVVVAGLVLAAAATRLARGQQERPASRWRRLGLESVRAIPEGLRRVPGALRQPRLPLSAALYWAGDCGVLVLAFHAVHGAPPLGVIVLAYMLGQLGNALPLPGGVGGVEPLMLGVFTASGVPLGLGAAAIVLYRVVSLGLQAVAGTVAVASLTPLLEGSGAAVREQTE